MRMRYDSIDDTFAPREQRNSSSIDALVTEALAAVRKRMGGGTRTQTPTPVEKLAWAYLADDPDTRRTALSQTLDSGITAVEFITDLAPRIARTLGDMWEENRISFVEVTIGSARLQETVRNLSRRHRAEIGLEKAPKVLLASSAGENHLIGMFVAADSFRRLGCDVILSIDESDQEVLHRTRPGAFDLIGVSVSSDRQIRNTADLVKILAKATRKMTPIVLGGAIIDSTPNLDGLTGADYVTGDPNAALTLCNVKTRKPVSGK